MPSVFFSYCHADEELRDQLEKQLAMLKRQGIIETWHDRRIIAGQEIDKTINGHVNNDDIILLLVSPDFIASDYCYEREMMRALERHESGEATVIPVILRACDWHHAPFGKLMATPKDGKPVKKWADADEAFLEVAQAVRAAAQHHGAKQTVPGPSSRTSSEEFPATPRPTGSDSSTRPVPGRRSSNLRLAKAFTQRDKDGTKISSRLTLSITSRSTSRTRSTSLEHVTPATKDRFEESTQTASSARSITMGTTSLVQRST